MDNDNDWQEKYNLATYSTWKQKQEFTPSECDNQRVMNDSSQCARYYTNIPSHECTN